MDWRDDTLTREVIGAAIDVHRELGPGLLESVYSACLARELVKRGVPFERSRRLPVIYGGEVMDVQFVLDFVVDRELVVELKSVEHLLPVHRAQLITYLRLSRIGRGLLINFNVRRLVDGVSRLVNDLA